MAVREGIAERPRVALAVAVVTTFVAVLLALQWKAAEQLTAKPDEIRQFFFTVDDGKTWFADGVDRIYPFDRDGQPAYRVHIYKCSDEGEQFPVFLEQMSESVRRRAAKLMAESDRPISRARFEDATRGRRLVKRPGDVEWVEMDSDAGNQVMEPKCPEGSKGTTRPVFPVASSDSNGLSWKSDGTAGTD